MAASMTPAIASADGAAATAIVGPAITEYSVAESAVAASAVAAPAAGAWPAAPAADAFFGECIIDRAEQAPGIHHVQWTHDWNRVTERRAGITGWAKVLHTTDPTLPIGGMFRFHKCFVDPCQAN